MFCAEILRIAVFLCKEAKGRSKCTAEEMIVSGFPERASDLIKLMTMPNHWLNKTDVKTINYRAALGAGAFLLH
jgi:hypothetical protein